MGFVHHSNYLNYFEMARIEWLSTIGFPYKGMEQKGIIMPVVSAKIKFKSPAFFDNSLRIKLTIYDIPKATIKIYYTIVNEIENELAKGSTTLAFLNVKTKRPVRCPKSLLDIIQFL
tara:strand:- start:58 stop:408 length:351 start_codon:yes stop_codon:yes gene_type:complete